MEFERRSVDVKRSKKEKNILPMTRDTSVGACTSTLLGSPLTHAGTTEPFHEHASLHAHVPCATHGAVALNTKVAACAQTRSRERETTKKRCMAGQGKRKAERREEE